jgi:hypothetical protein
MSKSSKAQSAPEPESQFSQGTDPRSLMIYAHGNKAIDSMRELGMPCVLFVFDQEGGEMHACSYKMKGLSEMERQLFQAAALSYPNTPNDVPTDDEE